MLINYMTNIRPSEPHIAVQIHQPPERVDLSKRQEPAMVPVPKPPKQLMNTIAETAKLCRERDMGLNDSTLRYLCKSGALPCLRVGSKTLINWNVLIRCLFSKEPTPADKADPPITESGTIRPVPVRIRR